MKYSSRLSIALILFLFVISGCGDKKKENTTNTISSSQKRIKTLALDVDKESLEKFLPDPCDKFSIEFSGLYTPTDSMQTANEDTLLIDNFLKKKGFAQINAGWGNWEEGPRIMDLTLVKDQCTCHVYKKYYTTDSSLRITEKLVCNALNNAVD